MEIPVRRSNYTLLNNNQFPDDPPPPPYYDSSISSESKTTATNNNKLKSDRGFDWDSSGDQRNNRNVNMYTLLQRQSSGSSYGESSLSGEYNGQNTGEVDPFGYLNEDGVFLRPAKVTTTGGGGGGDDGVNMGSSSGKSWAQQTEESYQLQLALALRLPSEATCADDPNFLDPVPDESLLRVSGSNSPEALSHRFWVNGCLSYSDKIPDGFYLIHGMDPYVWTVCTDLQEIGRIPSIESLKSVDPSSDSSLEVVLIDRRSDTSLKELQNRVHNISCGCITTKEVVEQLAKLVCNRMGGSVTTGEDDFISIWRDCSNNLKDCLGSVVVPIGSLSVGLCRHRALLFKVLADTIDLPCRIAKECKYCKREDASSCLVRFWF